MCLLKQLIVGGVVGEIAGNTVNNFNTVSATTITAVSKYVGGIVGEVSDEGSGTIMGNTVSNSTIMTSSTAVNSNNNGRVGGIVGLGDGTVTVSSNIVKDSIITSASYYAGGIGGDTFSGILNNNVVINATITASNKFAGGLAGYAENAYDNFVTATVTSFEYASGMLATSLADVGITPEISNNAFFGKVTGSNVVSGLLASRYDGKDNSAIIPVTNSYAAAILSTTTADASYGVAAASEATITNSYYDSTLQPTSANTTGAQSTSDLKTPTAAGGSGDVYEGWDSSWDFGTTTQYPVLEGMPISKTEQCEAINAILETSTDCTY